MNSHNWTERINQNDLLVHFIPSHSIVGHFTFSSIFCSACHHHLMDKLNAWPHWMFCLSNVEWFCFIFFSIFIFVWLSHVPFKWCFQCCCVRITYVVCITLNFDIFPMDFRSNARIHNFQIVQSNRNDFLGSLIIVSIGERMIVKPFGDLTIIPFILRICTCQASLQVKK